MHKHKKSHHHNWHEFWQNTGHVRNLIFGIEDGLVSTGGVLFGVATATDSLRVILISGIITILVEASSMGIGSFLTEQTVNDLDQHARRNNSPLEDGLVMFVAYIAAGVICLLPYLLWGIDLGRYMSVLISLCVLLLVGYLPQASWKRAVQMVSLGGFALLVAFVAGELLKQI